MDIRAPIKYNVQLNKKEKDLIVYSMYLENVLILFYSYRYKCENMRTLYINDTKMIASLVGSRQLRYMSLTGLWILCEEWLAEEARPSPRVDGTVSDIPDVRQPGGRPDGLCLPAVPCRLEHQPCHCCLQWRQNPASLTFQCRLKTGHSLGVLQGFSSS